MAPLCAFPMGAHRQLLVSDSVEWSRRIAQVVALVRNLPSGFEGYAVE